MTASPNPCHMGTFVAPNAICIIGTVAEHRERHNPENSDHESDGSRESDGNSVLNQSGGMIVAEERREPSTERRAREGADDTQEQSGNPLLRRRADGCAREPAHHDPGTELRWHLTARRRGKLVTHQLASCMSQMSVSSMSITESSLSPQHRLHWLAEQTLQWSGLPVVNIRPTAFMEAFFDRLSANSVQMNDDLALPLGNARTSPIAAVDVAKAIAAILDDPAPHVGKIYELTGPESADIEHYARAFSEALGRTIRYRDVPVQAWADKLRKLGVPEHLVSHLAVLAEWHRLGRFDRMTDDFVRLTGEQPMALVEFVKRNVAKFTKPETVG